jgi:hypothetical protein
MHVPVMHFSCSISVPKNSLIKTFHRQKRIPRFAKSRAVIDNQQLVDFSDRTPAARVGTRDDLCPDASQLRSTCFT